MRTRIFQMILLSVSAALLTVSCDIKFPENEATVIYDEYGFANCLKPIKAYTTVKYNDVTFNVNIFPDAVNYLMEVYSEAIEEGIEPSSNALVDRLTIPAGEIPYTFKAPEEMNLYYRVCATNPQKANSKWTYGSFKTETDPTTVCSKPTNVEITTIFEKVIFNWDVYPDTEFYEVEIYNNSIPEEGEPSSANLVESFKLTPLEIPVTKTIAAGQTCYYRIRATAPSTTLRNSKWVKGSFTTEAFNWPTDETAITESYKDDGTDSRYKSISKETTSLGTGHNEAEVVIGKIHFARDCYFVGDRVTTSGKGDYSSEWGASVPINRRYVFFKICKPGSFTCTFRNNKDFRATVALITNKKGEGKKAVWIYDVTDIPSGLDRTNGTRTIEITEEMLYGITEAAEIRIFDGSMTQAVQLYPPYIWTPAE